jgi:hypothetical protein
VAYVTSPPREAKDLLPNWKPYGDERFAWCSTDRRKPPWPSPWESTPFPWPSGWPSTERKAIPGWLPNRRQGDPRFLTAEQDQQVRQWLAQKPTAHGFPTDLWTARRVADLIHVSRG